MNPEGTYTERFEGAGPERGRLYQVLDDEWVKEDGDMVRVVRDWRYLTLDNLAAS